MSQRFGERVQEALRAHGQLCVGIDPHAELLAAWGLDDDADGVREFGLRTVDAAAGQVGVVSYLSGSTTNTPVTVSIDNLEVR